MAPLPTKPEKGGEGSKLEDRLGMIYSGMLQVLGPSRRYVPVSSYGGSSNNLKDLTDLADGADIEEGGVTADVHEHDVCGLGRGRVGTAKS